MSGRLQYLMNDFVVQEHVCNLRCDYCLNFENENLKPGEPWRPTERIDLKPGEFGWQRAHQVLARCRELADAPILRIAGGEVMAIRGALDFVAEVASDWDRVQILTNATFLTRDIGRLARIENLNLCCSLDGHTPELNERRTPNKKWAMRIIDGVRAAIEAGVPVEIYTVLSATNVEAIYDFAYWLRQLPRRADVRLLPFPVRGKAARDYLFAPTQIAALRRLRLEYAEFAEILPPAAYFDRLITMAAGDRRRWRCRVPLSFIQTFDDGVVAACSNCWAAPLGNIIEDAATFDRIGRANIHKLFLRTPPRVEFCTGCFTPFDVVNVFLDGHCSIEDICSMDLYRAPSVRVRLLALRQAWADGGREPLRIESARTTVAVEGSVVPC
jgi:MoaA/NifB/PqqE/SkfB family radical SAM enzyme